MIEKLEEFKETESIEVRQFEHGENDDKFEKVMTL